MKKTAIALAMATVLGVAGTAMAANPFTDVPANHWSYASVSKLAQAGIIEGYGDGTFRGNNSITRYEMAQMVAKAMARSDKADAAQKAMIEKLAAEYSAELNNLGVRVSSLEKKVGSVKVTGDARIRYRSNIALKEFDDNNKGTDRYDYRVRLGLASQVNDKVDFTGRIAASNITYADKAETDTSTDNALKWDLAYFTFKDVLGGKIDAGRFAQFSGTTGLIIDVSNPGVDGVRYTYDDKNMTVQLSHVDVSTNLGIATNKVYAAETDADGVATGDAALVSSSNSSLPVSIADVAFKAGKKLTVNGAYFKSHDMQVFPLEAWSAGASYKFDKNWKVAGEYVENTADEADGRNDGYYARVNYKGADYAKKGSWGMYADYRKAGEQVVNSSITTLLSQNDSYGAKGWGVGVNYALYKNVVMAAMYENLESYDGSINYDDFYRVEMGFKF